jgi:hypothetical protein
MLVNVDRTKLKTCLVLCPLNTILNWQAEFENWLEDVHPLDVRFLEYYCGFSLLFFFFFNFIETDYLSLCHCSS